MTDKLNLVKSIEGKFGNGKQPSHYEEELKDILTVDEIIEVVEEYVTTEELTEENEKDFDVLYENKDTDFVGEGSNVMAWYNINSVLLHEKSGYIFISKYSVNYEYLDEFTTETGDYDGDIRLYPYTEELQQHLETFNRQKEEILEDKRKENKKYAEEARQRSKKLAQERKETNAEIKQVRDELANIITEQGFKQLRSAKGNLISQYELVYYTYEGEKYGTFGEVLKAIEKDGLEVANIVGRVRDLTERRVRVSVQQKGRLEVVKKYTSKSILGVVTGYLNILNKKKGYQQQDTMVLKERWEQYKEREIILTAYITEQEKIKKAREEASMKAFGELLKMFR